MKSLWNRHSHNVIFVLFLILGLVISSLYLMNQRQTGLAKIVETYEVEASQRYALINQGLASQKRRLASVRNFFHSSERVSEEAFQLFIGDLLIAKEVSEICWISVDSKSSFVATSGAFGEREHRCLRFNVSTPNRFFSGEVPELMLSEFAQTRGGQKGFVVIVFPLSYFAQDKSKSFLFAESLVFNDRLTNTLITYRFIDQSLEFNTDVVAAKSFLHRYWQLEGFEDLELFYLAQLPSENELMVNLSQSSLLSGVIFVLFLIIALYSRNILGQRNEISRQVEMKTHQLQASNSELEQFAYRTSHDLRGPLSTIRGLSHVMAMQMVEKDYGEVKRNILKVSGLASRLEMLVGDLFNLSLANQLDESYEVFDFSREIEQIFELLRSHPQWERQVELQKVVPSGLRFRTQVVRLRQVLENLVTNGWKYRDVEKSGQFVVVSIQELPSSIELKVSDNGLGIPEEFHPTVFSMFRRFHHHVEGSGLGLYLVQKHVHALGGEIEFTSNSQGSEFKIHLPVA